MKKVVILASLLMGCSQFVAAQTGDAAAGEALTATCAACHGADGNSAAPTFPKLAGLGEKYLLKQLKDIRDGARPVPTMVGQVDNMSDQDLANIAAYYDAQPRSGGQADPALVELGEKIYRAGVAERKVAACAGCHSPQGKGNAPAGFPPLAGQHADYIAAQLKAYRKGYEDESGRTNDGDSMIMRTNAFGLSDKEIEAVASYASGLK
ncbi:cytochrome c4 [Pseudohalioglobus sediminis]|uniref:Cytochrome c4 n=1 Tax=Pseudohalioglobus sediminis TaxID=2606449 RepID=A0A5B0WUI9_9GAMM|nr:c-type cytochrome [Pseudohalioglobus sediminis]KAA1190593.1 cytochrome c4 [Pseudohalioglobus sediminis]